MSGEMLRKAAALMRARAEAATAGEWEAVTYAGFPFEASVSVDGRPIATAESGYVTADFDDGDALHIASWHPRVALAVANLLDRAASEADEIESLGLTYGGESGRCALGIARAYLGADA